MTAARRHRQPTRVNRTALMLAFVLLSNLCDVARELSRRLASLLVPDADGGRHGGDAPSGLDDAGGSLLRGRGER